jgi:hypothetical protein
VLVFCKCLDEFLGEIGRKGGEKVLTLSFAFLAGENIDGLGTVPCLDGRPIKESFAKRQRNEVVFPASRTCE